MHTACSTSFRFVPVQHSVHGRRPVLLRRQPPQRPAHQPHARAALRGQQPVVGVLQLAGQLRVGQQHVQRGVQRRGGAGREALVLRAWAACDGREQEIKEGKAVMLDAQGFSFRMRAVVEEDATLDSCQRSPCK